MREALALVSLSEQIGDEAITSSRAIAVASPRLAPTARRRSQITHRHRWQRHAVVLGSTSHVGQLLL